ncbi:LysR family transcriptional regulator [Ensifer sp. ENS06]|uniref:LysR family transcriptional regulator n=1 Tax=Ensifer sp. ENS06 TaxID=2769276 RepID=UPI00177FFB75|nr:LysR family transcriptional regulator [Ensifer sp. ENS06]MBD9626982.1 LysR family transcriptional regulator [Ensifer sp. ENS06]
MHLDAFRMKHFRMLVALDERKKVSSVAEMFGISQPSLSRTLSELEIVAGHRLFERTHRGTTFTAEGEVLLHYARTVLTDTARAKYDMEVAAAGKRGSVSIGTVMTPASDFIVPALTAVQEQYADLDFNITVASSDTLLAQIMAGQLDFAVCRIGREFNEAKFEYLPLGHETLRMVVALTHPLAERQSVSGSDLTGLDWALQPAGSYLRNVVEDYHRRNGIIPKSIVSTSSELLTLFLVRESGRVGIFAQTVAELYDRHGMLRALRIDTDINLPGFGLLHLKGRELSASAKLVYQAILKLAETDKAMP